MIKTVMSARPVRSNIIRTAWKRKMMNIVQTRPMLSESIPAMMRPDALPIASSATRMNPASMFPSFAIVVTSR